MANRDFAILNRISKLCACSNDRGSRHVTRIRAIVHEAADRMVDFLRSSRDRKAWQPVPKNVQSWISGDIPSEPKPLATVLREACEHFLPYSVGNTHPRFFGWVHGTGLASGLLAGLLEAAMNANCGGRHHAAVYVERAVLDFYVRPVLLQFG